MGHPSKLGQAFNASEAFIDSFESSIIQAVGLEKGQEIIAAVKTVGDINEFRKEEHRKNLKGCPAGMANLTCKPVDPENPPPTPK